MATSCKLMWRRRLQWVRPSSLKESAQETVEPYRLGTSGIRGRTSGGPRNARSEIRDEAGPEDAELARVLRGLGRQASGQDRMLMPPLATPLERAHERSIHSVEMCVFPPKRAELTHRDADGLNPGGARVGGFAMQPGRARHLGQMSSDRRRRVLERAGEAREEFETQESQAP